jgi:hypothetical protein
MLALVRPDSWNLPLFLHVLGATVLVGSLVTAAIALIQGWRRDSSVWTRLAFRVLLLGALPSFIVMRAAAEWIRSREHYGGSDDPAWIGIGYGTSDSGGALLLISLILVGLGARRLGRGSGETSVLARVGAALTILMLAVYVVAIWAMTTKPA